MYRSGDIAANRQGSARPKIHRIGGLNEHVERFRGPSLGVAAQDMGHAHTGEGETFRCTRPNERGRDVDMCLIALISNDSCLYITSMYPDKPLYAVTSYIYTIIYSYITPAYSTPLEIPAPTYSCTLPNTIMYQHVLLDFPVYIYIYI